MTTKTTKRTKKPWAGTVNERSSWSSGRTPAVILWSKKLDALLEFIPSEAEVRE